MNVQNLLVPLFAGVLTATAAAQAPLIVTLSAGSTATDVTNTGSDIVVVGRDNTGGVFRWTYSSGVETPLGVTTSSNPHVSTDGNTVSATTGIGGLDHAAYWTASSGLWTISPSMGASCGSTETIAYGLSGDGLTVAGGGYLGLAACAGAHASAWHVLTTIQDVGGLYSDPASRAFDTNGDGTICVGWKDLLNGTRQGARWVNGVITQLQWVDPSTMIPYRLQAASATNSSGATTVGNGMYSPPAGATPAWRWDASTGQATLLPNVVGGTGGPSVSDVSDDGSVIVGSLIWINNVPQTISDYVAGLGTPNTLGGASAISRDATAICGGNWVVLFAGALYVGTPFCFGDGSGTACPCGNNGAVGMGCASSINANGGRLTGGGIASLAGDSVTLYGSGMPNSSALYFQGTVQLNGGLGSPFGDGLRCASGTVIRLGTKSNVTGASQYPAVGDPSVSVRGLVGASGTRTYQVWYRNAAAFCTAATYNLSNGIEIPWAL
jgi:hypothetical protein